MGSLWLMALCAAFVIPVGVATAVYLEEYADQRRWWNRLIEVNIQNLAAVPSIVYGILGLAFLVRGPLPLGRVLLAGALTLGLLVLPVVIIAGREAIRAVPPSIREGSLALGATQWQTIWRQVLPAAIPGIATGVILALSRAIGETAPLILVGAAAFVAFNPRGPLDAFTALPIQIFDWISRPQAEFQVLAAAGIIVLLRPAAAHELRGHLAAQPLREEVVMTTRDHARSSSRRRAVLDRPRPSDPAVFSLRDVELRLATPAKPAVRDITLDIPERRITAFIGPSGCGKSTLLRSLNRMNDLIPTPRAWRAGCSTTARTSTAPASTRSRSESASGWCSRSPTPSPSRSTTTSPSARACSASRATWTRSWSARCATGRCGTRSRTASR